MRLLLVGCTGAVRSSDRRRPPRGPPGAGRAPGARSPRPRAMFSNPFDVYAKYTRRKNELCALVAEARKLLQTLQAESQRLGRAPGSAAWAWTHAADMPTDQQLKELMERLVNDRIQARASGRARRGRAERAGGAGGRRGSGGARGGRGVGPARRGSAWVAAAAVLGALVRPPPPCPALPSRWLGSDPIRPLPPSAARSLVRTPTQHPPKHAPHARTHSRGR